MAAGLVPGKTPAQGGGVVVWVEGTGEHDQILAPGQGLVRGYTAVLHATDEAQSGGLGHIGIGPVAGGEVGIVCGPGGEDQKGHSESQSGREGEAAHGVPSFQEAGFSLLYGLKGEEARKMSKNRPFRRKGRFYTI